MGIAFGKDGMWAVVDNSNHCVYVHIILIIKIKWSGSLVLKEKFNSPAGLAFDTDNNLYVVCR